MTTIILALLISTTFIACKKETAVDTAKEVNNPAAEAVNEEKDEEASISVTTVPTQPVEENITPAITDDNTNIPVTLETPSFSYYLSDRVKPNVKQPIQLTMKSSASNEITDGEKWFADNDLIYNAYEVPNSFMDKAGNLPDEIAKQWDN
jgi:hypothetical protein